MCSSLNVAVIGAGVSGLMAGRELQIWGHKVTIFEKTTHIGGTWAYDSRTESDPLSLDLNREVVHSSSYSLLRTLHPRHVMRFSDYPFSKSCRDPRNFPGHEEVLKFFNEFWVEFGLCELTHMSQALGDSGYDECVVESRKGEVSQVEVFEAVVVCNGHNTEPRLAALKVEFEDGDGDLGSIHIKQDNRCWKFILKDYTQTFSSHYLWNFLRMIMYSRPF